MVISPKPRKMVTNDDIRTIIKESNKVPEIQQKDIAKIVGFSASTVCVIINKYLDGDKKILEICKSDEIATYKSGGRTHNPKTDMVISGNDSLHVVKSKRIKDTEPVIQKTNERMIPGKHGAIKHELSNAYKNLNRLEFAYLKSAKNSDTFIKMYFKQFGYEAKTVSMLNEVWKRREDIIRYEDELLNHAVIKPVEKKIVEPMKVRDRKAMVDEDRLLADLKNDVVLLIKLHEDTHTTQARIETALNQLTASA